MRFRFTVIFILFLSTNLFSQQLLLPLDRYFSNLYDYNLNQKGVAFHTSVKPYLQSELDSIVNKDSLIGFKSYQIKSRTKFGKLWNNFLNDHLVNVNVKDFMLTIDPLFDFQKGKDFSSRQNTYVNTRGIYLNGSIGKKFSFSSSFYENQAVFVPYINNFILATKVVPSQGEAKPFKTNGYDYSMATGYLSYTPIKYFNFQFGTGKNFFGDGYRSLLLSDNAFNYPFFKITTTIWKIKYVNLYAQFQDIRLPSPTLLGKGYPKKFGTFHFLSLDVSKRLNIGLFESIIWQASDSTHYRGFDLNYLNPIIFYRPVEFSLGSPDNALMGLNTKFKLSNKAYLYGQAILDDLKFSEFKVKNSHYHQKYGFQLGLRINNLLPRLSFQTEYNQVRPYTYSHRLPMQNYGHYNQALAHPFGANFRESVSFLYYQFRRFHVRAEFMYAIVGLDSAGKNFGQNIYAPEYNLPTGPQNATNEIGQGLKTNILLAGLNISYVINPNINMRIEASYTYRKMFSDISLNKTSYFTVGIKTSLNNLYYDF